MNPGAAGDPTRESHSLSPSVTTKLDSSGQRAFSVILKCTSPLRDREAATQSSLCGKAQAPAWWVPDGWTAASVTE